MSTCSTRILVYSQDTHDIIGTFDFKTKISVEVIGSEAPKSTWYGAVSGWSVREFCSSIDQGFGLYKIKEYPADLLVFFDTTKVYISIYRAEKPNSLS